MRVRDRTIHLMPRRTGARHWFPDDDPEEERARLVALLEGETPR